METEQDNEEWRRAKTLFKSYYVVWKPQVGCEDTMSSRRGLNRTM